MPSGRDGRVGVSDSVVVVGEHRAEWLTGRSATWMRIYLRKAAAADFAVASVSVAGALLIRFGIHPPARYVLLSLALPPVWLVMVSVFGGYDARFIGTGSDEFRKVLNAGWSLTQGWPSPLMPLTTNYPASTC